MQRKRGRSDSEIMHQGFIKEKLVSLYKEFNNEFNEATKEYLFLWLNEYFLTPNLSYNKEKGLYVKNYNITNSPPIKSDYCGKSFENGEVIYSCRTCGLNPTCVLCESCFNTEDHEGHDVHVSLHGISYGCCDCGDEEAYKNLNCKYHKKEFKKSFEEISSSLSNSIKIRIDNFIDEVLNFIITVFSISPNTYTEAFEKTLEYYDYKLSEFLDFDVNDSISDYYGVIIWNDESHSYNFVTDLMKSILEFNNNDAMKYTREIDMVGRSVFFYDSKEKAINLSNDILDKRLGSSICTKTMYFFEELCASLIHYISMIIHPSMKSLNNGDFLGYFLEQLSKKLVHPWDNSSDEETSYVFKRNLDDYTKRPNDIEDINPLYIEIISDKSIIKSKFNLDNFEDIPLNFFPFLKKDLTNSESTKIDFQSDKTVKLKVAPLFQLFSLDSKLWKIVQSRLSDIYMQTTFSVTSEYRVLGSMYYCLIYPELVNDCLNDTTMPQFSIINFSVQIFTTPSIAKELAEKLDFIRCLFYVLHSNFSYEQPKITCYSNIEFQQITQAKNFNSLQKLHNASTIIHDVVYFFEHDSVLSTIHRNHELLAQIIHFISLFQGYAPLSRRADIHVEFESNHNKNALETFIRIEPIFDLYSTCFKYSLPNLIKAIRRTVNKIDQWLKDSVNLEKEPGTRPSKLPISYRSFYDGLGHQKTLIDFCVSKGSEVSFYYPLQTFLRDLLVHLPLFDYEKILGLGYNSLRDVLYGTDFDILPDSEFLYKKLLAIFEYPIRSLVLLYQINCNYWVRNGYTLFAIAYYIFESRYDYILKNLNCIQYMFLALPPDVVLQTLVERFELTSWFSGDETSHYSERQLNNMIFYFFSTLTNCLSDRSNLIKKNIKDEMYDHIIHLTIKPIPYNELARRLPDNILNHHDFNATLQLLCDFKPPEALEEGGSYSLKKEYVYLLNSFHYTFSQNDIDTVDQLKRQNIKGDRPYFVPNVANIPRGLFDKIGDMVHNEYFCKLIFISLCHCLKKPSSNSTILDFIIQIYLIISQDENSSFIVKDLPRQSNTIGGIWEYSDSIKFLIPSFENPEVNLEMSCVDILIKLIESASFRDKNDKLLYLLQLFDNFSGEEAQAKIKALRLRLSEDEQDSQRKLEEQKRKMEAKARRERIKNSFNAAQKNFIETQQDLYNEIKQFDGELIEDEKSIDSIPLWQKPYLTGSCIVCQDEGSDDKEYGVVGFIQPSRSLAVLPLSNVDLNEDTERIQDIPIMNQDLSETDTPRLYKFNSISQKVQAYPGSSFSRPGNHISSCGHILHLSCLNNVIIGPLNTNRNRSSLDPSNEFPCPLCESINNVILPIYRNQGLLLPIQLDFNNSFENWLKTLSSYQNHDENLLVKVEKLISSDSSKSFGSIETYQVKIPGSLPDDLNDTNQSSNHAINPSQHLIPIKIKAAIEEVLNVLDVSNNFILNNRNDLEYKEYAHSEKPLDTLLYSLAYTINFIEIADRSKVENEDSDPSLYFLDRISTIERDTLVILFNIVMSLRLENAAFSMKMDEKISNRLHQLNGIGENSLFDEDPFLILCDFMIARTSDTSINILNIIRLLLLVQIIRVSIGAILASYRMSINERLTESKLESRISLKEVYGIIGSTMLGLSKNDIDNLWETRGLKNSYKLMYHSILIFLKKCSLILVASQALIARPTDQSDELEVMLASLSLPNLESIFECFSNSNMLSILNCWKSYVQNQLDSLDIVIEFPYPYRLIALPERIDMLYKPCDELMSKTCKPSRFGHVICLVCSQIICQADYCCPKNGVKYTSSHQAKCCGKLGLYLAPKQKKMVINYMDLPAEISIPYLTLHGESESTDGSQMYLQKKRYDHLLMTYLKHQIPTKIVRVKF